MKAVQKFIKKYTIFIIPVVGVLIVIFLSVQILLPTFEKVMNLQTEIESLSVKLEKLIKKRAALEAISSDNTKDLYQNAETALPSEKDSASILFGIGNLSSQTQWIIETISFAPGLVSSASAAKTKGEGPKVIEQIKGANVINVSLNGRGTVDQYREFVNKLFTGRRLFDVASVNINFLNDNQNSVKAIFNTYAFYLPPITRIGDVESELPQITDEEKKFLAQIAVYPVISDMAVELSGNAIPIGKNDLFSTTGVPSP